MRVQRTMHVKVSLLVCIVVSVAGGRHSRRDRCDGLEDGTLIANPKGCKYFFACKSGTSKGGHCPRGLWFNAETVECDLPAHVKCHFDDPVPTITATSLQPTEASPPTASESATMSPSITDRPTATTNASPISDGHDEVVCPQQDTHTIQFVASKIDCRHYYICYHGSAVRQECSAELHWNAETNKCVSIANAGCNIRSKRPIGFPECPTNGNRFYPHPTECDYYIYCQHGFYSVQQCPFYHQWDVTTETCRWSRFTQCTTGAKQRHRIGGK